MGVPGLFPFLKRRYPNAFHHNKVNRYDHIYIDANALLYPIADTTSLPSSISKIVMDVAKEYGDKYGGIVHIYFDGPPHMGKIRHQRTRRFQYTPPSVRVEEGGISMWTNALFTPGTYMMSYIDEYVSSHMEEYKIGSFSPSSEPGEGEHKLIRDIKKMGEEERIAIVGKDADLILLSMSLSQNVHILRHWNEENDNTYRASDDIVVVDCPHLRSLILNDMKTTSIWNFIIPTFLVGNDFIPPVPELSDIYKSLASIIRKRKMVYDTHHSTINWKGLYELIVSLKGIPIPDRWVGKVVSSEVFDPLYYSKMPYGVDKKKMVEVWMTTIEWIFQYYHNGMDAASRAWQYTSSYSPTLTTLIENWSHPYKDLATKEYPYLHPVQSLALAIPVWLRSLLPEKTREDIEKYPEYYPYTFALDPMEHPIIPYIPYTIGLSLSI